MPMTHILTVLSLSPNANHCVHGCITQDDCKTFAGNNLYQQNLLQYIGAVLDS